MALGIRSKLFFISLGIIGAGLLVADIALTRSLEQEYITRIKTDLRIRSELAEREISEHALRSPLNPSEDWISLAKDLGQRAQTRMTFVTSSGTVIADSELPLAQVLLMENHSHRPEIRDAYTKNFGWSIRLSDTLDMRMLYAAIPFKKNHQTAGVVRVSLPLKQVDKAVFHLRSILVAASLLALAVAGLISTLAAHRLAKTLRLLARSAGKMVQGDLKERTRSLGHDEIAVLGKSLDRLAENLAAALQQLKQEKDLLGSILDSMQEGVLVLDGYNRIRHGNFAFREMLMLGQETLGKPIMDIIHHPELLNTVIRVRASQETASGEIEQPGLKPRRLQIRAKPLPNEPDCLLLVLVDVTQLRRLENMRKDFVANASHELRTPVASIRSATETLQAALDEDPESAKGFLDMIDRNATRLQQLVEDLLDLSRIESKEFQLKEESVLLLPFVQQVFQTLHPLAEAKGTTLAAAGLEHQTVKADPRALEQILSNLLVNAVKYSHPKSHVQVEAVPDNGKLRIRVVDNGPGIAAEHLSRVFERFYRIDAGRSRELGGTGLGLAIVKNLVEAMGGSVGVESEPGKGTSFSFTLEKDEGTTPKAC